jgi:uncharacterized membrane protein YedE/YeeE
MTNFTPVPALIGGVLIGASALILWLFSGRIAGISGILGGLASPAPHEQGWRIAFLAGLVAAPLLAAAFAGGLPEVTITGSTPILVAGGLLVGFGTRLGGGCTSGHGVCGMARRSPRSVTATLVFMAAAAATVFVARHLLAS